MAAKLRYGVIGTGMMGIEHVRNLALVPGAELVAFADPHAESRRWARLVAGSEPREYDGTTAEDALAHVQALALRVLADRLEHGEGPRGPVSVSFETFAAA